MPFKVLINSRKCYFMEIKHYSVEIDANADCDYF